MSKSRIVRVWIAVACLSLVISACSSSPKKQGKEEPKNTEIKSFQAPEIPPVLHRPAGAGEILGDSLLG